MNTLREQVNVQEVNIYLLLHICFPIQHFTHLYSYMVIKLLKYYKTCTLLSPINT